MERSLREPPARTRQHHPLSEQDGHSSVDAQSWRPRTDICLHLCTTKRYGACRQVYVDHMPRYSWYSSLVTDFRDKFRAYHVSSCFIFLKHVLMAGRQRRLSPKQRTFFCHETSAIVRFSR